MPDRTLAPFGRRLCPVVSHVAIGAYDVISVLDAEGPPPDPGQFYMLAASERWGGGADERPFLPRAFSVLRRHEDGRLEFLFENVGPGTRRLCELRAGDGLWLLGPLGIGFRAPEDGRRPLLVGGGVGIAPLAIWQDVHRRAGAARLPRRARTPRARRCCATRGSPRTTARSAITGSSPNCSARKSTTRAWSTPAGRRRCSRRCGRCARRTSVPAQLALESGMACGYGACFGCVVPTRNGYVRLCVDGPVLDADDLELVA